MKHSYSEEGNCLHVLRIKGITKLYHFTDKRNIQSIIDNGGLYSCQYCQGHGIKPYYASSDTSRSIDSHRGLSDYVRLSFVHDHPMKYIAQNEGRISYPVVLIIDLSIVLTNGTKYSTLNAADNCTLIGTTEDVLKKIDFSIFNRNYFDLSPGEKKKYQAEVLIPRYIPLRAIKNIGDFMPKPQPSVSTYTYPDPKPQPSIPTNTYHDSKSRSYSSSSSSDNSCGCAIFLVIGIIISLILLAV